MDYLTIPELFRQRVRESRYRTAYSYRVGERWQAVTWGEFGERVSEVATGLLALGVEPGGSIAIVGDTRPEWIICDLAVIEVGCLSVGVYQTLIPEQAAFILKDCGARVVFVEDAEQRDKVLSLLEELPELSHVLVWDVDGDAETRRGGDAEPSDGVEVISLAELKERGRRLGPEGRARLEERVAAVSLDDPAIVIYTSGTTGPPKGALSTHRNIAALLHAGKEFIPHVESDTTLSFLPMAHAAEHLVGFMGRIRTGMPTAFARELTTVIEDIKDVRPTVFGSVPRIFEKAYQRIQTEVGAASPARRTVFRWAERVGLEVSRRRRSGRRVPPRLLLQHALADRLVFRRIRGAFGGRVRFFISGAAPIAVEILEFFHAAGLLVIEVYGQTECTAVCTANRQDDFRFGTVGKPIPGCEVRLAEDGEILVRGDIVFPGYLNRPEDTAEAIRDGWLYTGDIGEFDRDGFLRITDRKKNIIVTAGGKNIAPANIETLVKNEPLVSQVMVHGDRRHYLTALITLDPEGLEAFAAKHHLDRGDPQALVESEPVRRVVEQAVAAANRQLSRYEQVKKFTILPRDFSLEEGELTPTLKVKRKVVEERYRAQLDAMYD